MKSVQGNGRRGDGDGRIFRGDYRPPAFLVEQVDLHLELDAAVTRVSSRLALRRNRAADTPEAELRLDGENLALARIAVDNAVLAGPDYRIDRAGLTIPDMPERFHLDTEVVIHPDRNRDLMGLYAAGGILCTQCEPEAFRRITFFPDRPDVLARFRTTLTADAERFPVLLANGNPVGRRTLDDGRHQVVWDDPHPKPGYLFAVVAGDLERIEDRFVTMTGNAVDVHFYVERGQGARAGHAVASIRRAMAWDESRYGREYDLDVFNAVAISHYTMGAMENKGLNIFNDRYVLADAESTTDRGFREIDALIAHEYFHNWSGNRVTCRDWFQLALKEGFTVFREQQYVADHGWAEVRRIEDARLMRTRQFAEDAGALAHSVRPDSYREIDNFYTDTVYSKGAELIGMLYSLLGRRDFRRACDLYFDRHDGQAVTVEDFLDCLQEVSGRDLAQFARWYDRSGTPRLAVTDRWDGADGVFELQIEQQLPGTGDNFPLHMPLAVGLLDESGRELAVELDGEPDRSEGTVVLEITAMRQRFRFTNLPRRPVPALLRGFSAPVVVHYDYTNEQLRVLAVNDRDGVVRRDAIERLFCRCIHDAYEKRADADSRDQLWRTFGRLLDDALAQPGLTALLLELPDVLALSEGLDEPDLEAIAGLRDALKHDLAGASRDRLEALFDQCAGRDGTAFDPLAFGRRALSNLCLDYLSACDGGSGTDRCLAHYRQARNMTDTLAALEQLAGSGGTMGDWALADFRRRWRDHPLAMDHWFAVQARSERDDVLERVIALTNDSLFSIDQPNRVRSLIEVFCSENPLAFNRIDGSGYRFLADCVIDIDPVNPPLAAGLLRYLLDPRGMTRNQHNLKRRELQRVGETPGLSSQSAEIVEQALGRE